MSRPLQKHAMHVCNKCEHLFDEPLYIEEREVIDYGIGSRWVTLWEGDVCPVCESSDIDVYYVSKEGN